MCPKAQFGEECIYCFERNLVFLFASVHRDLFCSFRQNIFGTDVKNAFYVSLEYFLPEKSYVFLNNFRTLDYFSAIIPTSWRNRQNCIPSVDMRFEDFFKKTFFRYSWAWSKKICSFVAETPAGLSNFILPVHRIFLRKNLFFGKK